MPFLVGEAPEGYVSLVAGRGEQGQEWDSDSFGSDEPFVVLAPGGDAASGVPVLVSITGYQGYQGGLDQASAGYLLVEETVVNGVEARFWDGHRDGELIGWPDLVVVRPGDLALRVTGPGRSLDELAAVARSATADPARVDLAPTVVDPPGDLNVVGSVDAEGVVALGAYVYSRTFVPGMDTVHSVGWVDEETGIDSVVVQTMPEGSVDVDAYVAWATSQGSGPRRVEVTSGEVAGRPTVRLSSQDAGPRASVAWAAPWGETVIVTAMGQRVPSFDVLERVAAGVEPTDEAGWEEQIGDLGLYLEPTPEPGRRELFTGTEGEIDWLVQGRIPQSDATPVEATDPFSAGIIDPCVRFADGQQACAYGGGSVNGSFRSGASGSLVAGASGTPSYAPNVVMVATTLSGDRLQVTDENGSDWVRLWPIEGTPYRAAVVFRDITGLGCAEPGDDPSVPDTQRLRLEVIAADNSNLGCVP